MKKLLALAVAMATLGAVAALVALRILSRPRVAPAPYGPLAPVPPLSDVPAEGESEDPRLEMDEAVEDEAGPGGPGMLTESGVLLPEEVLAEERDEGMPAPLAAVGEPEHDVMSQRDVNGHGGVAEAEFGEEVEVTDEPPSHHTPPPVSEVVGEMESMASDIADVEPSHHLPPPVSEVTGEHVEDTIEAEESLAVPLTDALSPSDSEADAHSGRGEGNPLTDYFDSLASTASEPDVEVEVETLVVEVEAAVHEEPVARSVDEALATLPGQSTSALGQRDAESHLDEGNVYFNVGQYGLAIERYGKAIELAPDLIAAYYNRANARTRAGEYDGALADYDAALRLQPNDPDALNNRGMLHLYRAAYPEALQDFNAALAIDPTDTTVMVNRGLAHLHGGDAAAALVDFREASSLDTNDAAAHYGAGQASATLGNREEALRHVTRALEIDPAYAREAAADPKLQALQGDEEFMRLLRESGTRAERP